MNAVRRHESDARVPMHGVVPGKERLTVGARILSAPEAHGEVRTVLHRLELRLREGTIVRYVRPAVAFSDIQVDQQRGHRFRAQVGTAISMEREDAGGDIVACHAVGDELFSEIRALAPGDQLAHDMAAEDVQDDVEVDLLHLAGPAWCASSEGSGPRRARWRVPPLARWRRARC